MDLEAELAKQRDKRRLPTPTVLGPDAPAPRTQLLISELGPEPAALAITAWQARLSGMPLIDIAHEMGLTIPAARALINDAYTALREDLKDNIELNRTIDLARVDELIKSWLPLAQRGDPAAANVMLKALSLRSRLASTEPTPASTERVHPQNVLVWVQQQLPAIEKLVQAIPQ
jgi:hypothetical protein